MPGTQFEHARLLDGTGAAPRPEWAVADTRVNAEILRAGDDLLSPEQGKLADLIVVDGDPLDALSILEDPENIHAVMLSGEVAVARA